GPIGISPPPSSTAPRVVRIPDARSVREQVADGYGLPGGRALRQVIADGVLHARGAALLQDEDRRGRELFGEGAEAKLCLRRVGDFVLQVRRAVAAADEHPAAPRDENRAAEPAPDRKSVV